MNPIEELKQFSERATPFLEMLQQQASEKSSLLENFIIEDWTKLTESELNETIKIVNELVTLANKVWHSFDSCEFRMRHIRICYENMKKFGRIYPVYPLGQAPKGVPQHTTSTKKTQTLDDMLSSLDATSAKKLMDALAARAQPKTSESEDGTKV